jgi:FkbM family methyltransferase
MYKSQIRQDEYISKFIFNEKKNGFFIELGAVDGITNSNTYYFEKVLGWKGLCIEANPNNKEDLNKNRDCHKCYSPIYATSGKEVTFDIVDCSELSGITNHMGDIGKYKVDNKVTLKTRTLTEVLDEINAPKYIDYMSLDTEGSELHVLMGLDFNKYTIGYMNIEHNYNSQLRKFIHKFLPKKGYDWVRWNKFDDEFMHESLGNLYLHSDSKTDMTPKFN